MRTYELVSIFDPALETEAIELNLVKVQDLIIAGGGIIRKWERWGKRRLMYEIRTKQYGYYVLVVFDAPPSQIAEIDRSMRINPSVVRHLVTALESKHAPEIDIESVKTMGAIEAPPETLEVKPEPIVEEFDVILTEEDVVIDEASASNVSEELRPIP
jgi:small subunit ribosomal protein S6